MSEKVEITNKIRSKLTNFYIKKIKRWMLCPKCFSEKIDSKMKISKNTDKWMCNTCGYTLSSTDFESNSIFWFCDGCGAYLNEQENFDINNESWQCTKCGHNNDLSPENIINKCAGCGKLMPHDYEPFYCPECRKERIGKVVKYFKLAKDIYYAIANQLADSQASNQQIKANSSTNSITEFVNNLEETYETGDETQRIKIDEVIKQYLGKKWRDFLESITKIEN